MGVAHKSSAGVQFSAAVWSLRSVTIGAARVCSFQFYDGFYGRLLGEEEDFGNVETQESVLAVGRLLCRFLCRISSLKRLAPSFSVCLQGWGWGPQNHGAGLQREERLARECADPRASPSSQLLNFLSLETAVNPARQSENVLKASRLGHIVPGDVHRSPPCLSSLRASQGAPVGCPILKLCS